MSGDNGVSVLSAEMRVGHARAELERARHRSGRAFDALRREVEVQADWPTRYQARPLPFLVAAFFVGFLLAK